MVPEPVPKVPVNGGAVSPKHTDDVAVVMVPTELIPLVWIVKLTAAVLQLAAPVEARTSITSPPEITIP